MFFRFCYLCLLYLMITIQAKSQQNLFYSEPFDDNINGWTVWDNEWNSARFEKGQYLYEMKGNYTNQTWNNKININANRDFAIETSIKLINGKAGECSYWLEWGIANVGKDYFAFGIYADGKFGYGKTVSGKWKSLIDQPVAHQAIQAGAGKTNLLRVEKTGTTLIFRINGTEVHRTTFESFPNTAATGFEASGPQKFAVDYLQVYQDAPADNNKVSSSTLYPTLKKLDWDADFKSGHIYAGCLEGNCEDGTGTYLEVNCDRWNENKAKLMYKFYKGSFSKRSARFTGSIYYKEVIVDRKNTRKALEPEKGAVDFSNLETTCTIGESGEMKLSGTSDLFAGVRYYSKDGRANGMMVKNNSVYAEGYFHDAEPVYMYLKDKEGNQFWGLVNHNYEKVAGYEKKVNGAIYTGGFYNDIYFGPGRLISNGKTEEGIWNRGGLISAQPVYIPDTGLLKKAAMNIAGNLPFTVKLDPLNVEENNDNGFGGRFYTEQGDETSFIQNGNGLVLGYHHQVYFGHFSNGKANGMGFFASPRWPEIKFAKSTNVYGGFFEQGKFMVGPVVHKTRIVEISSNIIALLSSIRDDANFQEERKMILSSSYYAALKNFREKAQKGVPNAIYHVNKFNESFTNKEDFFVNKPSKPELQKTMDIYFAGKPNDAIKELIAAADRGDAEAMYYLAGFYEKGIAAERHIGKSDEYYRKSVQGGYIRAAMPLARKYLDIFERLLRYGIDFNLPDDDSAMKYYMIAAQSQPLHSISPAEIQEGRMGYYRAKYPGLRNSININIQLGDDANPNTSFGRVIAMDKANKQREADMKANMLANINKAAGSYYYCISSHQIIYVAPYVDRGGTTYMLNAEYLHYNPTKNFYSSVEVSALLNPALYKRINFKETRACGACKGEGVIRRSYKTTVADYEYTLGVKIVQSGSNASGCLACGGGGLVH
jgi:hypothetical protein